MRVIIAGPRTVDSIEAVIDAVEAAPFAVSTVVSGGCRGIDKCGEQYAEIQCLPVEVYEPEWDLQGRAAGPVRNRLMANNADALIAIVVGGKFSAGTLNMVQEAAKAGLPVYLHPADEEDVI